MTKAMKTILGQPVAVTGNGPKKAGNNEYLVTHGETGVVYLVKRHQYIHPCSRWAWQAIPVRDAAGADIARKDAKVRYEDRMDDMLAFNLGYYTQITGEV